MSAIVATCGQWWRAWDRMTWPCRACSHLSHHSLNHSTFMKARWWDHHRFSLCSPWCLCLSPKAPQHLCCLCRASISVGFGRQILSCVFRLCWHVFLRPARELWSCCAVDWWLNLLSVRCLIWYLTVMHTGTAEDGECSLNLFDRRTSQEDELLLSYMSWCITLCSTVWSGTHQVSSPVLWTVIDRFFYQPWGSFKWS